MSDYRDPLREAQTAWQQGTQGVIEGLSKRYGETLRQDDIKRADTIRTDDLARREGATAYATASQQLQQASEQLARLTALPPETQQQYAVTMAQLNTRIGELQNVVTAGERFAADMLRNMQGANQALPPVPALIGQAAGQAGAGERILAGEQTTRQANSNDLRAIRAELSLDGIDPTDPTVAFRVHSAVARAQALAEKPVMPGDEQFAQETVAMAKHVLEVLRTEPMYEQLWRNYLLRDQASTDQAVATATAVDLENDLRRQSATLGEVTIDQARTTLAGMEIANYETAFDLWNRTGVIHPNYSDSLLRQFGGDTAQLEARSIGNFDRWQRMSAAQEELLNIDLRLGELNVQGGVLGLSTAATAEGRAVETHARLMRMQDLQLGAEEYVQNRRTMQSVLDAYDNWAERVASMVVNGDLPRLRHLITVADAGGLLDGDLYASLMEGGVTGDYLRQLVSEASANEAFRNHSRDVATRLATLEVRSAVATGQQVSATARTVVAQTLDPDEVEAWFYSLTREEREAMGGEVMLSGMRREARVGAFLSGEPMRQQAYQQASAIMATLPRNAAEAADMANAVYLVLTEAGIDEAFAEAMFSGVQGLWDRDRTRFDMELELHKFNMRLIEAQIAEAWARANKKDGEGMDATQMNALRQVYAEERQHWQTIADMTVSQMEQGGCVVVSSRDFVTGLTRHDRGPNAGSTECQALTSDYDSSQTIIRNIAGYVAALGGSGRRDAPTFYPSPQGAPGPADTGNPNDTYGAWRDVEPAPPPAEQSARYRGASEAGIFTRPQLQAMATDVEGGVGTLAQLRSELVNNVGLSETQADAAIAEVRGMLPFGYGIDDAVPPPRPDLRLPTGTPLPRDSRGDDAAPLPRPDLRLPTRTPLARDSRGE